MKIAFFCNEYPPKSHGGIGTFVYTIANALAKKGHSITVVEFGKNNSRRVQDRVSIVTLKESRIPKLSSLIDRLRLVLWIHRNIYNIDICEFPDYQGWLPFPLLNPRNRVVIRLHSSSTVLKTVRNHVSIRDVIYEYFTLFWNRNWISVSKSILEVTKKTFAITPDRYSIIYNPSTVTDNELQQLEISSPPHSRAYIVFVGSVCEFKGALTVARAAKILFESSNIIDVIFIGNDCEESGVKISEKIYGIVGQQYKYLVKILGRKTHIEALLWIKHASALVLPSRAESFGLAVVEAMTLGVPAIFSTTTCGPEIISNGIDGILVPPDDPVLLANAIRTLLNNNHVAGEMRKAGQKKASNHFSIDVCAQESLRYYDELITL